MEFWAELKSEEELDRDFHMIYLAFAALAEEIVEAEESKQLKTKPKTKSHKPKKAFSTNKAKPKKTPLL
jgi:hypothetical protein